MPKNEFERPGRKSTVGLWKQYDYFIRSLNSPNRLVEPSFSDKLLSYLKKLLVVFFGAFFITFAFYFFIEPNTLYNGGVNGFLQVISQLIIGKNGLEWRYYRWIYYGLALLVNTVMVIILWKVFDSRLDIISTSIFFVLSQLTWTFIFDKINFLFSRFSPAAWKGVFGQSELSLSLPYYLIIALVAAILYSFGNSLILRAQATTGGFDNIAAHFATKKSKFPIGVVSKIFSITIISLVALTSFLFISDNETMKMSFLERDWEKKIKQEKLVVAHSLPTLIEQWKRNMAAANEIEGQIHLQQYPADREQSKKEIRQLRYGGYGDAPLKKALTNFLGDKTEITDIELYPREVDYLLANSARKEELIQEEINELNQLIGSEKEESEPLAYFNDSNRAQYWIKEGKKTDKYQERLRYLKKQRGALRTQKKENKMKRILRAISNNEKLWATLLFIFVSSYLVDYMFPRKKIINVVIHFRTAEDRDEGIKLLKQYSPIYCTFYRKNKGLEEPVFLLQCKMNKWNFYLHRPYLKQLGKVYEN